MRSNTLGFSISFALIIAVSMIPGCRGAAEDESSMGNLGPIRKVPTQVFEGVREQMKSALGCPGGGGGSILCCNAGYTGMIWICGYLGNSCCVFEQQLGTCEGYWDCGTLWANLGCVQCS